MEIKFHKNAAAGSWFKMSIAEQMGNIGSEVSRAKHWQREGGEHFWNAVERALELFDLTLVDPRWHGGKLIEIARAREVFVDAVYGGKEYNSSLEDLDKYFLDFALMARS